MNYQKSLLSSMLKIRIMEEKIVQVYSEHQMKTPTHLSIGQEAVSVGLAHALTPEDLVFVSHRCHAAYLARGGDVNGFFAEICGRSTGSNEGRGGSAHLSDTSKNVYSSPILGAMIPVAAGAALSFQMDNKQNVAVAIFGDAGIEEGVFAETLNIAVTKKLPMLFVCENNTYSTHTHLKDRQPPSPIIDRVKIPELFTKQVDGNDVESVYQESQKAVEICRQGEGPVFIEFLTYRVREHVGPLYDYDRGYRSKTEVDQWINKCPIKRLKDNLINKKLLTEEEYTLIENQHKKEADLAYELALNSPWPDESRLLANVY